uniref:Uncharacterized protein n=1 Tax=Kalanchoe fedtschenkoi TaxID=63787 RepID=A0A7N1A1T2_KALFE
MASSINVLRCPNAAAAALPSSSGDSKGLRSMNVFFQNENISQVCSLQRSDKGCFNKLKFGITRSSSGAGEGDTQPFPNGKIVSVEHNNFVGNQSGVESRVDGIGLGTLSAQTVPTATGFPPVTMNSIWINHLKVLRLFRRRLKTFGMEKLVFVTLMHKMVVVVDDEDREIC